MRLKFPAFITRPVANGKFILFFRIPPIPPLPPTTTDRLRDQTNAEDCSRFTPPGCPKLQRNPPQVMLDAKLIWFIAGIVLILAEFVAPGVVVVFFGVGAVITSITTWLGLTPGIGGQAAVFGASSVLLLFTLRRYVKSWFVGKSADYDGDLDDDFTGREARVIRDIPGDGLDGRVEIKGAEWKARAVEAIPAGTTVIIERRDGLTLHVRNR